MNHSHWWILVFVATMVCNGNCRPRDVDVKNLYPVYRSDKQLELETPNRYEKPIKSKPDDDSVAYLRIDIPYKNDYKTPEKLVDKNSTKSVIDYVPVALTVKKTNVKKWPSDQNGIESADDLSLYNIYTNNINPLNLVHATTPGYNLAFPYVTHSKPSILILEELTTPKPFYDYPDSVFTRPVHVHNRPVVPPPMFGEVPHPPFSEQPAYTHLNPQLPSFEPVETTQRPFPAKPVTYPQQPDDPNLYYPEPQIPNNGPTTQAPFPEHPHVDYRPEPPNTLPGYPTHVVTPQHPTYVEQSTHHYVSSTLKPETTTKKRKSTKCPNVSIIASSSINNNNGMNKEGCQDISIHIDTNLSNTNAGSSKPAKPVSSVTVQNEPNIQTGIFGIVNAFWSVLSKIFDFSFSGPLLTTLLSPFSAILAGGVSLSALVFPWLFPQLMSRRKKRPKHKFLILGNSGLKSIKYLYRTIDDNSSYLKRTKRGVSKLQSAYAAWDKGKKISRYSSDGAKTEREAAKTNSEVQNADQLKETKFNIESIATVARASSDGPSLPSSASIGQLIDTMGQMVDSDIRTPPKLKEIIKEKSNENRRDALGEGSTPLPYTFVYEDVSKTDEDKTLRTDPSEGKASQMVMKMGTDEGVKGIAIPVVMDDMDSEPSAPPKKLQKIPEVPKPAKEEKKKNGVTKIHPTTTPSSGLSTWILLSDNKDVTTPSPKKNNTKKESNEDKKKTPGATPTTKKPIKIQVTTLKASMNQANKKVTSKPTNVGKKPDNDVGSMSALEAMVKNQKKNVATTYRPKTNDDHKSGSQKKPTDPKKKFTDRLDVAETKDKFEIELSSSKPTYTLPTNLPVTTEDKSVTTSTDQSNGQATTESSVEGTTKKKSNKKKKKNKNRRRKPANDTGVEAKIPQPAVGSQIYNFISREIVPTVGLGLIGVALTAGLASFLGYNPFASTAVPLRRTYESHHGYTPNNYYNYNTEYGDGGQSEEVLFREVLSGMPDDSRYGLTRTDSSYPEAYNRQDQVYDNMKTPVYSSASGSMYSSDKDVPTYDSNYPQDYSSAYGATYDAQDKKYGTDVKDKYPVYSREAETSFVYPETTGMTSPDKTSRNDYETQNNPTDPYPKTGSDTIERQPEALYRVAGETDLQYRSGESTIQGVSNQNSWHKIGSPADAKKAFPHLEPGPRSLDLSKVSTEEHKRSKRDTESVIQRISRKRTKKQNDVENEIDFEDDNKFGEQSLSGDLSTTTSATRTTTAYAETTTTSPDMDMSTSSTTELGESTTSTKEDTKEVTSAEPTDSYEEDHNESTAPGSSAVSVLDVLKRLAQFKLRLGLNFLRSTTDLFSRYLDDIQRRVDESFTNTTTTTVQYNKRKNPWSRIFFSRFSDSFRRRRSVLDENHLLSAMFTEENKMNERFSKSTKKDLRLSDKIFHQKKNTPKKYESNRIN